MNRPDRDRPDDTDAVFSEIVADLRAEGVGAGAERGETSETAYRDDPDPGKRSESPPSDWRVGPVGWDSTMLSDNDNDNDNDSDSDNDDRGDVDDDHFVPPEPPPLPRLSKAAVLVLLFFAVGLLLLLAPGVAGIGATVATPLGILALATGLGFLLLRSREGPPPGSDPENGAQV
ncbi:MAG: hypothetical protein ACRDSE_01810 [Pseudonocardiaceae bacterium]